MQHRTKGNILVITYGHFRQAWAQYTEVLGQLATLPEVNKICEVGAGANPSFPLTFVREHHLQYTILDISTDELDKAPSGFNKLQADIADPNFSLSGEYDLAFSRQLAEHVKSGLVFHKNVHRMLREGGCALHFFPTLFTAPFVMNLLLPSNLSEILTTWNDPRREKSGQHGKFVAHYSWCRGPLSSQIKRFNQLGYKVDKYHGFFGHDYYDKLPPLRMLANRSTSFLLGKPMPLFTSYAFVVLTKDSSAAAEVL